MFPVAIAHTHTSQHVPTRLNTSQAPILQLRWIEVRDRGSRSAGSVATGFGFPPLRGFGGELHPNHLLCGWRSRGWWIYGGCALPAERARSRRSRQDVPESDVGSRSLSGCKSGVHRPLGCQRYVAFLLTYSGDGVTPLVQPGWV